MDNVELGQDINPELLQRNHSKSDQAFLLHFGVELVNRKFI